jgi:hypothetical protein
LELPELPLARAELKLTKFDEKNSSTKKSVDELSVDEMSVDKLAVDKMSVNKLSVDGCTLHSRGNQKPTKPLEPDIYIPGRKKSNQL